MHPENAPPGHDFITHLVRTSDKEETRVELLQEHNALALEAASKEDQDSSRGDGSPAEITIQSTDWTYE